MRAHHQYVTSENKCTKHAHFHANEEVQRETKSTSKRQSVGDVFVGTRLLQISSVSIIYKDIALFELKSVRNMEKTGYVNQ